MVDPEYYLNGERFTISLDELLGKADLIEPIIGRSIVANGCFDILHKGHLSLLANLDTIAYRHGLRPIVAINSDESVRRLKGERRPQVPQESRAALLNNLKWPFTVVIFDEDTPQRLMDNLRPRYVLKGDEYPTDSVIRWEGSEVLTVPMVGRWSTSRLLGDTR